MKPTRDDMDPAGDHVPPRWANYRRRGRRADVWLTSRPARLLVWWGGLFLVGVVGLTLIILSFFADGWLLTLGIILLVPTWLNLAPDIRYIPRGWRAWRTLNKG